MEPPHGIFIPCKTHQQEPHRAVPWLNWVQKILIFLASSLTLLPILWRAWGSPKIPSLEGRNSLGIMELCHSFSPNLAQQREKS